MFLYWVKEKLTGMLVITKYEKGSHVRFQKLRNETTIFFSLKFLAFWDTNKSLYENKRGKIISMLQKGH